MRVHVLTLTAGTERYALPSSCVVEVVPAVKLRAVPGTPPSVAGLLAYRGRIVPVVDLARRLGRSPASDVLSTRIAVCAREGGGMVGVLAADVTRVGEVDPDAPGSHPGPAPDDLPALGRVTFDAEGLVQLVDVEQLLSRELLERLDHAASAPASGGGGVA